MHAIPKDRVVEMTFPATRDEPRMLPRQLRVVTFNVHMERGDKIVAALSNDPALRDADLIVLEEVHRRNAQAAAPRARSAKTSASTRVYAPGHVNGDGNDGVAIVSRAPITSARR